MSKLRSPHRSNEGAYYALKIHSAVVALTGRVLLNRHRKWCQASDYGMSLSTRSWTSLVCLHYIDILAAYLTFIIPGITSTSSPFSASIPTETFTTPKIVGIVLGEMRDRFREIGYDDFMDLLRNESDVLGLELRDVLPPNYDTLLQTPLGSLREFDLTRIDSEVFSYHILVSAALAASHRSRR